jgi:hypothetical protein
LNQREKKRKIFFFLKTLIFLYFRENIVMGRVMD